MAGLISTVFFPNEFVSSNLFDPISWKFGLGPILTSLAAFIGALAFTRRRLGSLGVAGPLMLMAAINLALNARSQFGLAAAAALFCILKVMIDALPGLRSRFSIPAFIILLGLGIGVSQILIEIYEMAAKSGVLGMEALDKYQMQSGQGLNLLQAGRIESLVSIQAILDSPILGHGSWARDINYVILLVKKLDALGFPMQGDPFLDDLIPTHSHLFGAWVESGVAGGIFWIGALLLAFKALYRLLRMENAPTALISFLTISMVWDIFFSPFGQEQRFLMALKICLALWVIRRAKSKEQIVESS